MENGRFADYNFREYALRRTKERVSISNEEEGRGVKEGMGMQFMAAKGEKDPAVLARLFQRGVEDDKVRLRERKEKEW